MKSFADTAFFLLFEEILRRDRPKDGPDVWSANGVSWRHTRHTFEGHTYGFTVELYEMEKTGRTGWTLLVAKEHWWAGRHGEAIRSGHWAKPLSGNRATILAWLKGRKKEIEAERDTTR